MSIDLFTTLKWFAALVVTIVLSSLAVRLFGIPAVGIVTAVLSLAVAIFLWTVVHTILFGAPYVASDDRKVAEMLELAGVREGDAVADLGSGDGRILIAAAKAGALAEGWEINPFLWIVSNWNIRRAGVHGKAKAHLGSFWSEPMRRFSVVTVFFLDTHMPAIERKLLSELPPGARVVSNGFAFPEWEHEKEAGNSVKIRLYRKLS